MGKKMFKTEVTDKTETRFTSNKLFPKDFCFSS